MASSGSDTSAPSMTLNAQHASQLRRMVQTLAAEQDVPVPELRDTVLCGIDALSEDASPLVHEAAAWLGPAVGMHRERVECLATTQMELEAHEKGSTVTAFRLPKPCEHDELVLEFDDQGRFVTHYFRST